MSLQACFGEISTEDTLLVTRGRNAVEPLRQLLSAISSHAVVEAAIVLLVLTATAVIGGKFADWTGALAVFATFLHGQLSFDMQESQGKMVEPTVANYHWSGKLFVSKELLWIFTFLITGSWSLCAGSLIFATYPRWRTYIRHDNTAKS